MRVIVHGGAGGTPEEPGPRQAVLDDAAAAGTRSDGALGAVEDAVGVLESSERFNAGVGGAVQSDGIVRTDAGVMLSDRSIGAACTMPGVERAVSVARVVLEATPHVLVSGVHAVDLAAEFGIETDVDLLTERTRERFAAQDPPEGGPREQLAWLERRFGSGSDRAGETEADGDGTARDSGPPGDGAARDPEPPGDGAARDSGPPGDGAARDHDTVGAVAFDGTSFAAATSTGGRSFALAGRVGDVPQAGSGFFCTGAGGASATGAGEDIVRVTLARQAVAGLEEGLSPDAAAGRAIRRFEETTGSGAGVIVLGEDGAGSAFNTDGMQTSVATDE